MAGRPQIQRANIEQLKKLADAVPAMLNGRPMIAYTMKQCGCSYEEIGQVFGVTRQQATTLVQQAEREL